MEKYESKQYQIRRPAAEVYCILSDFSNFTPVLKDKVEGWQATENHCSFRLKGFSLGLDIIEKVPFEYVKIGSEEEAPITFTFWIQLKEVAPGDTRMKLTLHAELNMMTKMMLGGKLREAVDKVAEQIANAFNGNFGDMPGGIDPGYGDFGGFGSFDGKEKLPS